MQDEIEALKMRYVPIRALAQEIPGRGNQPIHWMTVGRWCRPPGSRGVVLESAIIGNQRCVTRAALDKFIEAVTRAADGERPAQDIATRSHREKNALVRELNAKLAAAGA
jgi:hypothetical protein